MTGHRDYDPTRLDRPLVESLIEICGQFNESVTIWCGMALGFDMAVGEAVIEAKGRGVDIHLICVVPFAGHYERLNQIDYDRYQTLLSVAERVIILSDHYDKLVFLHRNDYLLEQADMVVAYHNGTKKGGTAYTIRHATKMHIPIINLYPQQQLSLW